MTASIARSHEQQVHHHRKKSHILQPHRTDEHEVHPIFRLTDSCSHHNSQHRSRSSQQPRSVYIRTEVREHIVSQHIEQSSAQASQDIQSPKMAGRKETQEKLAEPIEPQHIEQQMQGSGMQEHISHQRPWLFQELRDTCRQLQALQPGIAPIIEKHQEDTHQGGHDKHAYINIYKLQADVAPVEPVLQIRNKTAHCCSFFANT